MEIVKVGRKGQLSIPRVLMRRLGIDENTILLVEETQDGGIVMRPAAVYPIERYSDERIREFLEEDRMTPQEARRVRRRASK
jgi:AbrB family looped-hinge helix DNA binding protein